MASLGTALPGTLKGKAVITLKPQFLTADALTAVLDKEADCGPLTLTNPPTLGYGKDDTISVAGQLSGSPKQVELFDVLNSMAEKRKVSLAIELLNPALCQIEGALPAMRSRRLHL